jgi:hypothetical protein
MESKACGGQPAHGGAALAGAPGQESRRAWLGLEQGGDTRGRGGILAEVGAPDTWAVRERERERESEEALGWAMAASRVGSLTGR